MSNEKLQRYVYMEDEGPSKDDRGIWVLYADAQRALDEEKKKVQTLRSAMAHIANTRDNYEKRLIAERALSDTEG